MHLGGESRSAFALPNDPPRLFESLKHVLPDTLFFETPKEPLDDPILRRRIGGDELLLESIIPTGLPKSPTLEVQPIVTAQNRCAHGTERAKSLQTGGFERSLDLLRPTPDGKLIPDDFAIMTINDGC